MSKMKMMMAAVLAAGFAAVVYAQGVQFPFFVYNNDGEKENTHFIPSGYMGDTGDIKMDFNIADAPKEGKSCIKVTYSAQKSQGQGWAGVFWQEPENNWGEKDGGYNLTGANKFIFWAKGAQGGEEVEFMVGGGPGKDGKKGNTAEAKLGKVTLAKDWTKYTIDLSGKDMSNIIFGFGFVVGGSARTFYIDRMAYANADME
ncbi:MAG TPA: hypothetical protein DET40_21915 [Lentisphaeria bacterium]|nr:MAG: hypothetical protein A2X45_04010 [Lentisphaerae bacterium GWF2_50_93]HCE46211.1 hypothetical protein [Lentisphaeria bacterium]